MKKNILWIGVGAVLVICAMWMFSSYNGLVSQNIAVDTQWAHVETQYQRRLDLIPNLVQTVKGITKQELAVFGEIAEARKGYAGAQSVNDKVTASNQMESAISRLLVITENYPVLRSSENFTSLTTELAGTENRISVERMRFNDAVALYNLRVKTFPSNIVAGVFGFHERALFKAEQEANKPVKVDFSN
jgi:LemA protein